MRRPHPHGVAGAEDGRDIVRVVDILHHEMEIGLPALYGAPEPFQTTLGDIEIGIDDKLLDGNIGPLERPVGTCSAHSLLVCSNRSTFFTLRIFRSRSMSRFRCSICFTITITVPSNNESCDAMFTLLMLVF